MALFIPPNARASDASNAPLNGAQWFFFVTGTTTPASVYTTSTRTLAHPHPVTADSGGKFAPIYFDPAVTYRAQLKTSGGTLLFDFDPYAAVLLDLDGTVYHEEHALPGAVELIRKLQREGRTYACLTNSTSSPERLSPRLKRMSVDVDPAHIYPPAAAACDYVIARSGAGSHGEGDSRSRPATPQVYTLSPEGVQEMLDGNLKLIAGAA
jgi:hypothetical protein